ncbi:MAG: ThiF family adenylyltransferase [Planctomycetes bacterium]|nr:ThiF family adenylyltransferase [Planctomycetota bacterium]
MFQKLVNHNKDIKQLVDKGYAATFDSNYLVVRDIPYLDSNRELQMGAIISKLDFVDQNHVKQTDHQVFFAGSVPYGLDAKPISNLGGGQATLALSEACEDVVVQRSFSNKPKKAGKFEDFFDKIESYVRIISGPAMELHEATPYTFRVVSDITSDTVFKFQDTLTSRAEITDLSEKLKNDIVAVIGAGGTGAYVLDFLMKTPMQEIRIFDLDPFHIHNAFRSPGHIQDTEFGKPKSEVYMSRYQNFRNGIKAIPKYIDISCSEEIKDVTFAFVCVDKGTSRSGIFDLLVSQSIPFIDVGMGLNRKHGPISGMARMTYYSAERAQEVRDMNMAPLTDSEEDVYKTNIQIAELNALNACLAVIKFKQVRGFYHEENSIYHSIFGIQDLRIISETEHD